MTAAALPFAMKASLLTADAQLQADLQDGLSNFGFDTRSAGTSAALCRLLGRETYDFCVLDASDAPEEALATVARVRAASTMGIVILTAPEQIETRIHALLIGADAYLTKPAEARELAAIMLGVARRLAPPSLPGYARPMPLGEVPRELDLDKPAIADAAAPAAPASGRAAKHWLLLEDDWILMSPAGVRVELSQTERALLGGLADRPGEVLSRESISDILSVGVPRESAAGGGAFSLHRISMLVSRVRKKARREGVRLPLRVVRGRGYEFYEQLVRPEPGDQAGAEQAG